MPFNQSMHSATRSATITPHATDTFEPTRSVWCITDGDVVVRFTDDSADETYTLAAGQVYPFSIVALRVTGTTATIKGLW